MREKITLSGLLLLMVGLFVIGAPSFTWGQNEQTTSTQSIFESHEWVDSIMTNMTLKEKVGQLFMVAAYSNRGPQHRKNITKLIEQYHIGGLIFFQGSPGKQATLTNHYQQAGNTPLLIAMDAEWGLPMRLDSTMTFPKQMTLGAIQDDSLIYEMGQRIAQQCKRLGVHINFAPVADVNNNPQNPVIHTRSFGENKVNVAEKASAYMRGMQNKNVLAVGKHFPGHGDTDKDSHKTLPVIDHSRERLDSLELFPFRHLIDKRVGGIMSAHLSIPALESRPNIPSSLSSNVVNQLLREEMGYEGLVFTDALNMKGVTNHFQEGEAAFQALKAGNDVLLFPENVPMAVKNITQAVKSGELKEATINESVRRILQVKYWSGLNNYQPIDPNNLTAGLNKRTDKVFKQKLVEQALTLPKNQQQFLPFEELLNQDIAVVSIGETATTPFQKTASLYHDVQPFNLPQNPSDQELAVLKQELYNFDKVILGLHNLSEYNVRTFGLEQSVIDFVNQVAGSRKNVLANFGSPYALRFFEDNEAILQAYQDEPVYQEMAAQAVFGGITVNGKMPVTIEGKFEEGSGLQLSEATRLKYTYPEEVGIATEDLNRVDSIAERAIEKEATPGCQILVAKEGKVIHHKSYGYHTYDQERPVTKESIYDIASITKVAGTMLPFMRLYDIGRFQLDDSLGQYLTEDIDSVKADLTLKEVLTHQAGLEAWIPFYKYTLDENGFCDSNYCYDPNSFFSVKVADGLYLQENYRDSIWNIIKSSDISGRGDYRYSDLGFFYLKKIVDQLLQVPYTDYLNTNFYEPMGMYNTAFHPREHFPLSRIVPTEKDNYFRRQLLHGYVHDPAAAMLGGVAGHAGLFSNANDMAKLMQMLLNGGMYGEKRYFSWPTIQTFTKKHYKDNRKGLGFDKPETDPKKISPTSELASHEAFGHTGFTGTCVWADPKDDLVYVFLSNRVHPTAENRKLVTMDVRTDIQRAIYESFLSEEEIERRKDD